MTVHLEVTIESLLNAIAQMSESEFNDFIEKAKKLRNKKTIAENDLIDKINTIYSAEKQDQ